MNVKSGRYRKTAKVFCAECGSVFDKALSEIKRAEQRNGHHFCGHSCAAAYGNKLGQSQVIGELVRAGVKRSMAEKLMDVYRRTMANAKRRGIEARLSEKEFAGLCLAGRGRCALTKIPFSWDEIGASGKHRRRPYLPSLDRIDSSKGYVAGNVRLVCVAANLAMNSWGEEVFFDILRRVAEQQEADPSVGIVRS